MASQRISQTIHFSQAGLMWPVVAYLKNIGVPCGKYLQEANIPPDLIADYTTAIPHSLIYRFINAACTGEDIEDIGLLVGQETSLYDMGEVGKLFLCSGTIRDYLTSGSRLISTIVSCDHYWLVEETEQLRFCASVTSLDEQDKIQEYLYLLLVTINTIRIAIDEPWSPTEITIPNLSAATTSKLGHLLPRTQVIRQGKYASFLVPYELTRHPITAGKRPEEAHKAILPDDFRASVTSLIEILIRAGHWSLDEVASATNLSSRSLQRRLRGYGTSHKELLLKVRVRLAKQWMADLNRPLNEIASALGYSNSANFSRAFRRSTGLSPRDYRNTLF